MLANERQLRRGIVLSFVSAMLQSLVAVVFVGIAAAVLALTSTAMGDAANWIGIASYALVALLGLWLIARKVFGFGHDHRRDHKRARAHLYGDDASSTIMSTSTIMSIDHDHDHEHDHDEARTSTTTCMSSPRRTCAATGASSWRWCSAVGLRPCSGALVVLVFALSPGAAARRVSRRCS